MTFYRQTNSNGNPDPIALIGVGCHLPGKITNTDGLLAALREGRDLITEIPPDRWNVDAFYDPDTLAPGKTYVRKGGFVEDVYLFDPGFFGITDSEAARMDPQQRLLLQTVWHALEDAGQSAEELMNSNTGVFLAMMNTNNYSHLKSIFEGPKGLTTYDAMGDAMSIAAGRVSHFLGLEGPCLTLDTACSSSLVALHFARQSILAGDCDMAIVAGVNIILHPGIHIAFSKLGLMSRAGRCATFDASADGYIRGEGCVAVVLRRQSDAIARGDRIIASIVGTAVNQDGRTPALTAPNGRSQEKVIRNALARTAITPNEIGYVEAHGTGTPVGDPIEMSAIVNVYGPDRSGDKPLYVGSVKSNFGHIEAGAGLLGLVKTALSLQHEEIFPSIHFNQLNPSIDLGQAPVRVATERIPWPRNETPRLAGINSFGYSGTNAHMILQEAPTQSNGHVKQTKVEEKNHPAELVVISAKSPAALDELIDEWVEFLDTEKNIPLGDIAFSSALARTQLSQRLALIGKDKEEIRQKLQAWREGRTPKGLTHGQVFAKVKPKIAFIFTGQGSQYAGMGHELYKNEPHFAETINRIASIMDPELGAPLLEVLFGEKSAEYLENTRYVQPALFAIEYALADRLRHLGIEPSYLIGHSVGEIVAACLAGVLDLEDAARFIVARGRLMGQLPAGGTMLSITASPEQVQRWIQGRETDVAIATVNGPHAVVISGRAEAVAAIGEIAQTAGRQVKELEVSHAFHSPLMDPILDELTQVASSMRISPPRIPIVSNTSGDFFGDQTRPEYWSEHVRNAVLFHQGMQKIMDAGCTLIVEIGPHPALTPVVMTAFDSPTLQATPTLRKDKKDTTNLLGTLSTLYVNGALLKFERLFLNPAYQRVSLPLYPFRGEKYSLNLDGGFDLSLNASVIMDEYEAEELPELPELHPLLGRVVTRNGRKVVFETSLKTTSPWTDHRVLDSTIFPGAGYVEMAARGFAATAGENWQAVIVKDVSFEQPLLLSYKEEKKVLLTLEQRANGKGDAKFVIAASDGSVTYCRGRIDVSKAKQEQVEIEAELSGRESEMKVGVFYGELRSRGLEYGARFANVRELWLGKSGSGEAFGRVMNATTTGNGHDPFNNAVVLDGCLQVFGAALATLDGMTQPGAYVPASVQSISFSAELPAQVWSHVKINADANGRGALVTIRVLNEKGDVLVKFENLELRRTMSLKFEKSNNGAKGRVSGNQIFKSRAHAVELLRPLSRKDRVTLLTKWLIAEVKETIGQAAEGLGLEKLPPTTAFLEIGLDSLLVTELQRRIQERLEFRFKPMQGLDYQSIETMAEFLHDEALAIDLKNETATVVN